MDPQEVHALAQQVLRDRLVGWAATGGTKPGTVCMRPALAPTEAAQRRNAFLEQSKCPPPTT